VLELKRIMVDWQMRKQERTMPILAGQAEIIASLPEEADFDACT
jgi:hypothetical protein